MSVRIWGLALLLSAGSHGGAACWMRAHAAGLVSAARAPAAPRALEIELAPTPVFPEPTPVTPSMDREPPQAQRRPAASIQVPRRPSLPPLAARRRAGVAPTQTVTAGGMEAPAGSRLDGELGTGQSMEGLLDGAATQTPLPARAAGRGDGPAFLSLDQVTTPPRMREMVEPEVPESFRASGKEALVVVEVKIDARGRVVAARVLRGADAELDVAALSAARRTGFFPAEKDGRPVPVRYRIPYRFRVRG